MTVAIPKVVPSFIAGYWQVEGSSTSFSRRADAEWHARQIAAGVLP